MWQTFLPCGIISCHMRLDMPLDDVLRTKSHVRVLRALHRLLPGLEISGRDVAMRAGVSRPAATEALRSLVGQGLVHIRRARRVEYFELNRRHVLGEDRRRLF